MKKVYDLKQHALDSMHDQRIDHISYTENKLTLYLNHLSFPEPNSEEAKLYYEKRSKFHSCEITFTDVEEVFAFAEVKTYKNLAFKGHLYYLKEFVEFLIEKEKNLEIIYLCQGYKEIIIEGALVCKNGEYGEDCVMHIMAEEMTYEWK